MSTATATAPTPASEPVSSGVPRSDFPTWLPPMLVKELRQGLRTRGFVGAFVVFQLLMALMMIGTVTSASLGNEAARAATASTVNSFFWTLLTVQLLLVTPVRALGALQSEIDSRTLDLLLLTRLSAWRIVVGKWASLVAQSALLLVAMLPYGIVRYFGGSVDLVGDALTCVALLGGCAVITAIMLWASGLPKAVRLIVPVIAIFGGQLWRPLTMSFGARSPFGSWSGGDAALLWFNGALMLVFFLVAAVRRIAPVAESHALLARGLPLLALLPVPLLPQLTTNAVAAGQLVFAGIFLAVVCMIELASLRLPMAAHWRAWARRGTFGRFAGRLFLPGWPSALLYASLVCAIVVLAAYSLGLPTPGQAQRLIWIAVLALGALVLPTVVLSMFEQRAAKSPGALYGLVFGAMSTLAAIAAAMSSMFPVKYTGFETFARVLPVSGLWLSLGNDPLDTSVMVGQAAFVAIVLGVAFTQSRLYWRMLALHEVRDRTNPAA